MAGQAAVMASSSVRAIVAPLACSSSTFVKPSDATRLCRVVAQRSGKRLTKAGNGRVVAAVESSSSKNNGARRQAKVQAVASDSPRVAVATEQDAEVYHVYRTPFLQENAAAALLKQVQEKVSGDITSIKTEQCYNIALSAPLSAEKWQALQWLLKETYEPDNLQLSSNLSSESGVVVEVGPRLSFTTAWSANAVSVCNACALPEVTRIERSSVLVVTSSLLALQQLP